MKKNYEFFVVGVLNIGGFGVVFSHILDFQMVWCGLAFSLLCYSGLLIFLGWFWGVQFKFDDFKIE